MNEGISEERLAEIRADHQRDLTDAERFGLTGLMGRARTRTGAIGELLAEVERLRGEQAAIGETLEEWGVRRTWTTDGETRTGYAICKDEDHACAALEHYSALDRFERNAVECALVKRLAGEWRDAE